MRQKGKDILQRAYRPLEFLLMGSVIAIFVVVLMEVVSRYIMHQSISWGSEFCQTVLVWITFIGGAVALAGGEHMEISVIIDKIENAAVKKALLLVGYITMLIFLWHGTIGGYKLVLRTWGMATTTLQIPAGVLYLAFPIGCALMIPVVLRDMLRLFGRNG